MRAACERGKRVRGWHVRGTDGDGDFIYVDKACRSPVNTGREPGLDCGRR